MFLSTFNFYSRYFLGGVFLILSRHGEHFAATKTGWFLRSKFTSLMWLKLAEKRKKREAEKSQMESILLWFQFKPPNSQKLRDNSSAESNDKVHFCKEKWHSNWQNELPYFLIVTRRSSIKRLTSSSLIWIRTGVVSWKLKCLTSPYQTRRSY